MAIFKWLTGETQSLFYFRNALLFKDFSLDAVDSVGCLDT